MNRKPKPIKPFKTLKKEADFWDSHDISSLFNNPKTPLSKLPLIEKEKEAVITVRLQRSLKGSMGEIARTIGVNTSTLARMWLLEKLNESLIPKKKYKMV